MVDIFYVGNQEPMWQMIDEIEHDKHVGWRTEYISSFDEALKAIMKRKERLTEIGRMSRFGAGFWYTSFLIRAT